MLWITVCTVNETNVDLLPSKGLFIVQLPLLPVVQLCSCEVVPSLTMATTEAFSTGLPSLSRMVTLTGWPFIPNYQAHAIQIGHVQRGCRWLRSYGWWSAVGVGVGGSEVGVAVAGSAVGVASWVAVAVGSGVGSEVGVWVGSAVGVGVYSFDDTAAG